MLTDYSLIETLQTRNPKDKPDLHEQRYSSLSLSLSLSLYVYIYICICTYTHTHTNPPENENKKIAAEP